MNSGKRQTIALIGIALLVIAGIMFYIGFSLPRVYEEQVVEGEISTVKTTVVINKQRESETQITQTETEKQYSEKSYTYPINLNTATFEELESIDGIGEVRASAILQYRDYIGKYTSVEQIKNIKGIDESLYSKIAGYLTV